MWFLQDMDSGEKEAFPGCSSRWMSQPRPAALCSWELSLPSSSSTFPAGRASLWLPCKRTAQSNSPGDFLRFLPRILFIVLCNRREMEKPKWPNRIVKPSRDLLDFYYCWLSGIGLEVKKSQFLKNHYTLWVRRILNLLCRKHWVPYGAIKGLTYRVIHTLTPCYILEISF